MTISQSRFGGNAEVGRNADWKERKKSPGNPGLYAGLGASLAGSGVLGAGKNYKNKAASSKDFAESSRRSLSAVNRLRPGAKMNANVTRHNEELFARWVSGKKPTKSLQLADVTGKPRPKLLPSHWGDRNVMGLHGEHLALDRRMAEQRLRNLNEAGRGHAQAALTHRANAAKYGSRAKTFTRVGRGALVAGGALAGGSLIANEIRRGTVGVKRSNKMVVQAPSAAMERNRRVNGM